MFFILATVGLAALQKNHIKRPSLGRDATTIITLIMSISGLYILTIFSWRILKSIFSAGVIE
jgi:hypothetical protein